MVTVLRDPLCNFSFSGEKFLISCLAFQWNSSLAYWSNL